MMKHIDLGVGPGWVVSTRSDAAQLWEWLRERQNRVLGLDLESNGKDQFDPTYRGRLCQFSDGDESWMIQLERPGMLEVMRTCINAHPYWVAHYAEADIRFAECAVAGSIRVSSISPHVADTQPLLAWYDPRTVTSADKPGIDARIRRPRGLKETAERLLSEGRILMQAEIELHAKFPQLLENAPPTPEQLAAVERWQPLIDQYQLSTSASCARRVLSTLGVESPKKTAKGRDSWTTATLSAIRPACTGLAADLIDAMLALRWYAKGPASGKEETTSWGFGAIPDDDEDYLRYGGLDPLMTLRLWHLLTREVKARGQWTSVAKDLKLQWHIDLMTLRGMQLDPPYVRWLDQLYSGIMKDNSAYLASHSIGSSAMGPAVGKAFQRLGIKSTKQTAQGEECWDKTVIKPIAHAEQFARTNQQKEAVTLAKTITLVRGATKFHEAYVGPMLRGLERDGKVHCSMRAIGTITRRNSAKDPPIQQSPKRTDVRIRPAFVAHDFPDCPCGRGCAGTFVSADLSQGEPRTMAARSGDRNLIRDLLQGDFYGALAQMAFGSAYVSTEGKDPHKPSYHMRDGSKVGYLLRCYGGGNDKLADALGRDFSFAQETRRRWNTEYSTLAAYEKRLNKQPAVVLDSGWVAPLWDRYFVTDDDQVVCRPDKDSRLGLNYDTQGSQRDLVMDAALELIDLGWSWALVMFMHDEVIGCVPLCQAEEFRTVLEKCMTRTYRGVPIEAHATIDGRAWMPQIGTGFDLAELEEISG